MALKYFTKKDVMRYFNPNYTGFATATKMKLFTAKTIDEFLGIYDEAYNTIRNYIMGDDDLGIDEKYRDEPDTIIGLRGMAYFLTTPDVYETMIKLVNESDNTEIFNNLENPYETFQYWLVNYSKFGKENLKGSFKKIDNELKNVLNKANKEMSKNYIMYKLLNE